MCCVINANDFPKENSLPKEMKRVRSLAFKMSKSWTRWVQILFLGLFCFMEPVRSKSRPMYYFTDGFGNKLICPIVERLNKIDPTLMFVHLK